jgi:UDP-N-acetylglucosamine diphosphorylase / glucose-1-phosphate thymidylyltransferase / UDP-N-acetylgalactosamine diphosphorylase / glucosamine-1-phosphate N-acetyltransferase / galactosamine-1-phosphate N-acetyltransferase
MKKDVAVTDFENNFYPFTQLKTFEKIKIGAFTFKERWQLINQKINVKDIIIPMNIVPTYTLLQYVETHKALPKNINKYSSLIKNIVDVQKNLKHFVQIDIALKNKGISCLISNLMDIENKYYMVQFGKNINAKHCYYNMDDGPIMIGNNVLIQEGTCLKGPLYIGDNTVVKMNTTIYGPTFIGKNCVVGGEIKNSVIMDNSNKAHYGYLGDSIIGEWCNLGAGTSNSNIKNNASDIIIQLGNKKLNAGFKFGMLMGDYSKSAINTCFNTGTVVGISCNIFALGLTPKYIPNFSWGVDGEKYIFDKAVADIKKWMAFKNEKIKTVAFKKLKKIYNETI